MKAYDIYISYADSDEAANAHGADSEQAGHNAADAVARFIASDDYAYHVGSGERDHGHVREVAAVDEDWEGAAVTSASAFPCSDGTWELHLYDADGNDEAITLPPTEFLSITDAAEVLGVTRQRVHKLLTNGRLHGRKVGEVWTVCRYSVEARAGLR